MSDVHAGPFHPYLAGGCSFRHHYCGVWLSCDSPAIPGEEHCADHFIALIAALDAVEYAARIARRRPA